MPVFPFFILLPFTFVNSIDNKKFSVIMTVSLLICFLIPGIYGHNVDFIYKGKPDAYLFTKHKEIPVFVLNQANWKYAELVPYFNDEQSYFFIDNINDSVIERYDTCYLIVENELEMKVVGLEIFEIKSEFPLSYFTVKKLIRNKQKDTL
jgi:hypothetical protein